MSYPGNTETQSKRTNMATVTHQFSKLTRWKGRILILWYDAKNIIT